MNINLMILTTLSYKYGLIAECFEKALISDNMNVKVPKGGMYAAI